jgi:AbrB family looped-hinge helix DNA binding protein
MVKLDEVTLTRQGQISIPKKIREKLHLEQGDKILFLQDEEGHILIQEVEEPIEFSHKQWEEFLEKTQGEPVTRVSGKKEALAHLDRLTRHK